MTCQRCGAQTAEVAHFCQRCGLDLRSPDLARRKSFAVKPDEPVASFALISTIMPRGAGQRPQTYRIALALGLTVALVAAIFGALPVAILVAAFTIPIVYIVYLYDVNLWEDEPVLVTVAAFLVTGALTVAWTIVWMSFRSPLTKVPTFEGGLAQGPQVGTLLLVGLLVPVVGQILTQLGPVYLASRPKFDDLMDGLTFGVISGVAYSTFDTLVRHSSALMGGFVHNEDAASWVALIFLEGFIKPLIMGTAAGIAAAEFSGLGRGYDGFTGRYFRGLAEAILANIAYQVGAYLFSFLPSSQGLVLTLLLGVAILGVLVLRVRNVLHVGLMEAALERAARSDAEVGDTGELEFCAACEMPLVRGAAFCNACGTAVRTGPRPAPVAAGVPDRVIPTAATRVPTGRRSAAERGQQGPGTSGAGGWASSAGSPQQSSPPPQSPPSQQSPSPTAQQGDHPSSQATPPRPDRRPGNGTDQEGRA